jgi:hypothetical protein
MRQNLSQPAAKGRSRTRLSVSVRRSRAEPQVVGQHRFYHDRRFTCVRSRPSYRYNVLGKIINRLTSYLLERYLKWQKKKNANSIFQKICAGALTNPTYAWTNANGEETRCAGVLSPELPTSLQSRTNDQNIYALIIYCSLLCANYGYRLGYPWYPSRHKSKWRSASKKRSPHSSGQRGQTGTARGMKKRV